MCLCHKTKNVSPGVSPRPNWVAYDASPDPLSSWGGLLPLVPYLVLLLHHKLLLYCLHSVKFSLNKHGMVWCGITCNFGTQSQSGQRPSIFLTSWRQHADVVMVSVHYNWGCDKHTIHNELYMYFICIACDSNNLRTITAQMCQCLQCDVYWVQKTDSHAQGSLSSLSVNFLLLKPEAQEMTLTGNVQYTLVKVPVMHQKTSTL